MQKIAAKLPTALKTQRALILATPRGKIQFADNNARKWLKQLFRPSQRTSHLPAELCRWLSASGRKPIAIGVGAQFQPARLYLRSKPLTHQSVIVALELISGKALKETSRRHRGLTAPEQEVLFWLARGKTNADIAAILGVAPATIGKHLERIYPKLGVENRTAASMVSQEERPERVSE